MRLFARLLPLFAAFCCLPLVAAPAKTSGQLFEELRKAMADEIAAAAVPPPSPKPGAPFDQTAFRNHAAAQTLSMYLRQLDNVPPGSREADSVIDALALQNPGVERINALSSELKGQLRKERADASAAFVKSVEDVATRAQEAAGSAKTDRDLDAVLAQITALRSQLQHYDGPDAASLQSRLTGLTRVLSRWQDYLAQSAAGDWQGAIIALHNVGEESGSVSLVPRSEVTARVAAVHDAERRSRPTPTPTPIPTPTVDPDAARAKADAILASIKEPSQIAEGLAQLSALRREGRSFDDDGSMQELRELDTLYRQVQAGVEVSPGILTRSTYSRRTQRLSDLRLRIVLESLPRTLRLPREAGPKPEENVGSYLDRVIAEAKGKHDWQLLLRAAETREEVMHPGEGRGFSRVTVALQALIVGTNREAAGQFALAVVSYQEALKDTSDLTPLDFVRDRLQAIQREHGKEYDEGIKMYLARNAGLSGQYQ